MSHFFELIFDFHFTIIQRSYCSLCSLEMKLEHLHITIFAMSTSSVRQNSRASLHEENGGM